MAADAAAPPAAAAAAGRPAAAAPPPRPPSPAALGNEPACFSGWLVKRSVSSRRLPNWKTRFVLLFPSRLEWRRKPEARPAGSLPLRPDTLCQPVAPSLFGGREHLFLVATGEARLVAQAPTARARAAWVQAVQELIAPPRRVSWAPTKQVSFFPLEEEEGGGWRGEEKGVGGEEKGGEEEEKGVEEEEMEEAVRAEEAVAAAAEREAELDGEAREEDDPPEQSRCFVDRVLPWLVIAAIMVFAGGGVVVLKFVVNTGIDPQIFALWRELCASASMFVFAAMVDGLKIPKLKHQPWFIATGVLYYAVVILPMYILQDMSALTFSVLQVQIPVAILAFLLLLKGSTIRRTIALPVVLSLLGSAIVFFSGLVNGRVHNPRSIGLWAAFLFAVCFSFILNKKLLSMYSYPTATAWFYLYTALCVTTAILTSSILRGGLPRKHEGSVINGTGGEESQPLSLLDGFGLKEILCLLYMVYLQSMFVYIGSSWVMTKLPLHVISICNGTMPLLSALIAVLVFDKGVSGSEVAGTLTLVIAMGLSLLPSHEETPSPLSARIKEDSTMKAVTFVRKLKNRSTGDRIFGRRFMHSIDMGSELHFVMATATTHTVSLKV